MKEPIIAVSSWALHRVLGGPSFYGAAQGQSIPGETHNRGTSTLLDLPAQLAARGIHVMEICHFHLPSRDTVYLDEVRDALQRAGVSLHAFLIDDGDLTSLATGPRDMEWINDWLPVAAHLGAQKVRLIAGKTAGEKCLSTSALMLRLLSRYAAAQGLQISTENWFPVLDTPDAVKQLLEETEGRVAFNLDFGNWSGADKYEKLAAIAPFASSCHAKAEFKSDFSIDADDYTRCLNLPYPDDFRGPFTMVAGGATADDWQGVEAARDFVIRHFQNCR